MVFLLFFFGFKFIKDNKKRVLVLNIIIFYFSFFLVSLRLFLLIYFFTLL